MDFLKKNWMQVLTLVLCAALNALRAELADSRQTCAALEKRVDAEQMELAELRESAEAQRPLAEFCWLSETAVDAAGKTITVRVELSTAAHPDAVSLSVRGVRYSLEWQSEGVYAGEVVLPVDEDGVDIVAYIARDGTEQMQVLQSAVSSLELLPVRLGGFSGDWLYDREQGGMYFAEWSGSLHDLQGADATVTDAEYRVYQNGKRVFSAPTEKQDTALFQYSTYESGLEGRLFPCAAGDEMELRFACADPYGLDYEFPIKRWKIEDGQAEMHWPTSAYPTLTWPE